MTSRWGKTALAPMAILLASALFGQPATSDAVAPEDATPSAVLGAGRSSSDPLPEEFVPITNSERLTEYIHSIIGPQAFLFSGAAAAVDQLRNTPREWGQGAEGYGKRYGSAFGQQLIMSTVTDGLAFGLHEDNRYIKSDQTGKARLWYAVSSALTTRHEDGHRSISMSVVAGTTAGAFIATKWQPSSINTMGDAAVSFGLAIGVRAGLNVAREYMPRRFAALLK